MATYVQIDQTQQLDPFKSLKKLPLDEFFTSGHRTCQGCESALVMKMMVKAAGPRTVVLGSTGGTHNSAPAARQRWEQRQHSRRRCAKAR